MRLFMCTRGNARCIVSVISKGVNEREEAKRKAYGWLGLNPDDYVVLPLTNHSDRVHIDVTIQV